MRGNNAKCGAFGFGTGELVLATTTPVQHSTLISDNGTNHVDYATGIVLDKDSFSFPIAHTSLSHLIHLRSTIHIFPNHQIWPHTRPRNPPV
jgi:hypothetical protein